MISKEPTGCGGFLLLLLEGSSLDLLKSFPCVDKKICEFWFIRAFCHVSCIPYYGLVI